MQWGTDGSSFWLNSHYQSGKSNVEADALSRIDWKKEDKILQADSIQAIFAAAFTVQGNDYIKTIPCSPQTIASLLPSSHDKSQVVCKSINMSEIELNLGGSSHLNSSWNPKFMTMLDWMKVQIEDQVIRDPISWYKARELHKGKDTDSPEMKQFLKERGKLVLRNRILYHKNGTQETKHPDRNIM